MKVTEARKRSRLRFSKRTLLLASAIILVGAVGAYSATLLIRHQAASKLGWAPDRNSDPGNDSSLKPSVDDYTSLTNDKQLGTAPSPTPKAAPGMPAIDLRIADDQVTNLGIFTEPGQSSKVTWIKLIPSNLDLSSCSLTDEVTLDDAQFTRRTDHLSAKAYQEVALIDGLHQMTASCRDGSVVSPMRAVRIMDRQPKACKGFALEDSAATASSLDELKSGVVGTWKGCVTTPWVPPYYVTMTFNADGTYGATTNEIIDGQAMIAMYYGTDNASNEKKYSLDTFDNSLGAGSLDVFFWPGNTNHDPLSNVKLMGNKLSFEFMHRSKYGPLKFELKRQ